MNNKIDNDLRILQVRMYKIILFCGCYAFLFSACWNIEGIVILSIITSITAWHVLFTIGVKTKFILSLLIEKQKMIVYYISMLFYLGFGYYAGLKLQQRAIDYHDKIQQEHKQAAGIETEIQRI